MLSVRQGTVKIHSGVDRAIRAHSRREADKGGYEAVGFIAAKGSDTGIATVPLHNHSPDPHHGYFVEPWMQFKAERELAVRGYTILGTYHSHVMSEALPSQTDHQMARARQGEYVLIYSVVFDELKAYYAEDGMLVPVELQVDEGGQ